MAGSIDDISKKYGREMAVVILCCRVFLETATMAELEIFVYEKEVNWLSFMRLAKIHRIRPVVYKVISAYSDLPAEIRTVIRNEQTAIIQLNLKQAFETERIILLLNEHGIDALPYKGAAFSKQFFGDLAMRESSDIDMVIKPTDLPKAIEVLKQDGYLPELDNVYNYLGTKYFKYYKDYNLNKYSGNLRQYHLELHWAIAEDFIGVDPAVNSLIYDADTEILLAKTHVKALNHTSHFGAVIIHHTLKDTFKNLKNVVDISKAMLHPDVQEHQDVLRKKFGRYKLKKILQLSNAISGHLMGVALNNIEQLPVKNNDLPSVFINQVCSDKIIPVENGWDFILWIKNRALLQDNVLRKTRFLLISAKYRFIPGEKDFVSLKFPKPLFFMYYIVKPFRSFIKPFDINERKKKLIPSNN